MHNALHKWYIFFLMVASTTLSQAQTLDTVCASAVERVYRVQPTPGSTYFWQVQGAKIISDSNTDSIKVQWSVNPGTYTISVVERSIHGCFGDTVKGKVLVGDIYVSINGATDVCKGQAVLLTAHGAKKYMWNTGATTQSILANPQVNSTYSVVGYNDDCGPDTATHKLNVYEKPTASFSFYPEKPVPNEPVTFTYNGNSSDKLQWIFNNNNTLFRDSGSNVTQYMYEGIGEKEVTLVVENKAGCTDRITLRVNVDEEAYIFVPTAFTPDGDNLNDIFKPVTTAIKSIEVEIFSRWGERVFTLHDLDDIWDGTFKGRRVEEGVYIYTLKAQGINNRWYYMNGNITVLY